jgi:hypothetical protein
MPLPPLVASGQVVAAAHANALRNYLPLMPDGTPSEPGKRFESDPDTGFHRPGSNQLAIVCGGSARVTVSTVEITAVLPVRVTASLNNSGDETDAGWSSWRTGSSPGATKLLAGCGSTGSYLQSMEQGLSWSTKPLYIQPNGGKTIINGGRLLLGAQTAYADDGAAGLGGLVSGDVYWTPTGEVRRKI